MGRNCKGKPYWNTVLGQLFWTGHMSHIFTLATATGHGVDKSRKISSYVVKEILCILSFGTNLKSAAEAPAIKRFYTIALMYFCTGKRFSIELQAVEHSIYRFPPVFYRWENFPLLSTPCPQGAQNCREVPDVAHLPDVHRISATPVGAT